MAASTAVTPTAPAPPLSFSVRWRLSVMMFLQYAIWGAWLPLFFAFITEYRGLTPGEAGMLFAVAAVGALVAPFFAGQIADRWFNTEKFLGISHILGAVLIWQLAAVESYGALMLFGVTYSLIYAPTLSLTNSLAFHHLPDRDRDFGRVRVWGTIGWIVVGIGLGHWLLHRHTLDEKAATVDLLKTEVFDPNSRPYVTLSDGRELRGAVVEESSAVVLINLGTQDKPVYRAFVPADIASVQTIRDRLRPEFASTVGNAVERVKNDAAGQDAAQKDLLRSNDLTVVHIKGGGAQVGKDALVKLKDGAELSGLLLLHDETKGLLVMKLPDQKELMVLRSDQMQSVRQAEGDPIIGAVDKETPKELTIKRADGSTQAIARDEIVSEEKYGPFEPTFLAKFIRIRQVVGMGDAFRVSAVLGLVMGVFCFLLPATPPKKGASPLAFLEAWTEIQKPRLLTLFLIAFPISCIHQFYFVYTASFLSTKKFPGGDAINKIMGVGGGGLMTIGQIAEIAVLALMPILAKKLSRKSLLAIGLMAYSLRFFVFAYVPSLWVVLPALALHGVCFGCFFFVAFMIVDEETTSDVRASTQSMFNLIVVGLGVIFGNLFAGIIGDAATKDKVTNFTTLFSIPMWVAVGCLLALLMFYPGRQKSPAEDNASGD